MTNKNFNNEKINNNGYEYVDLGLPSGTLWATCNVGAKRPSDFGLYFQWGDTKGYAKEQVGKGDGKKRFGFGDYKWCSNFEERTFTKYTKPGSTLELEDDAARANMGGDWHIPSPEQIQELLDNTTRKWSKQDGVNGTLFTSKKDNSKSIFIPAAGFLDLGFLEAKNRFCDVWASRLAYSLDNSAESLELSRGYIAQNSFYRNAGFSIRGVMD